MKKTILFLAAAAVALVACNKTEPAGSENADNGSPRFRISVNIPTKNANAYTETTANNLQDLIVYGGLKQNGQVVNKSILWANDKPSFAYLSNNNGSTSYYFLTGTQSGSLSDQLPLPLGTTLDAIFLGGFESNNFNFVQSDCYDLTSDRTGFNDYSTVGSNYGWNKPVVFEKDNTVADYLAFKYVNTDQQQFDVVYGVKNDIKSSETTIITLKHAQALINLNVKVTNPDAANNHVTDFYILFIDVNAKASNGTLKDYLLGQQSGASSSSVGYYYSIMRAFHNDMSSPASYDAYMPLKKVGDFVIDNTRNTPVAEWHLYQWNAVSDAVQSDYANVKLRNDASINSSINSYATQTMSTSFTSDYLQAGSQLIPEQPRVNPWLYYKIDGTPYLTEVNIPRGIWERGHVYTYNLKLTFGDMRFTIDVEPYDAPIVFQNDL